MSTPLQDRGVEFALVDVFGVGPLTGNPLAVIDLTAGAKDAPLEWMRSVAREMNQAETTFVLPATRQGAHRRLRSFTAVGVVTTRFFNPGSGLDEDPATGSAAGPLAAYLAHLGLLDVTGELSVRQG